MHAGGCTGVHHRGRRGGGGGHCLVLRSAGLPKDQRRYPGVSATLDNGDEIDWTVDDWLVFDYYLDYRFQSQGIFDGSRLRLGVRNLTDEDPPLFDNSAGYQASLHSNRGRNWYVDYRMSF